ncbi:MULTISPECIES: hypothetical protein [Exiguobacterium]|uniref:hypothetical protein n=1 Tax=Exiguobacterium TaxID=33986 RepID=UPI001BE79981|nr:MULTISPECIES: hypothetical protein [Exiguobacterium]MCT4777540.1 hypothetical protein [Exiguobacterium aquaticum]MCT4788731.1 hypothetical protein [Exiguobacterium mexicanum]
MKEEVRASRAASRKRKRLWQTATVIALIASLVGVIAFAALMDSKKSALPETDDIATESVNSEAEATEETDAEAEADESAGTYVYIAAPYTKVFADDRVTVIYEADLGDRFEQLESISGFVKLQLNERTTGWVTEAQVTGEATSVSDDDVTAAWKTVVPTADEATLDVLGQDIDSVRAKLGAPKAIQRDQVNAYHFYDGFFLMVRDQQVRAIDWDRQAVATPEVTATSSQSAGSWYEGETRQLKLFPYDGVMRVRIEQK